MLEKFHTVNVIQDNDLSYDGCKKVQERPYSAFGQQKDENIISRTAIDLVSRT